MRIKREYQEEAGEKDGFIHMWISFQQLFTLTLYQIKTYQNVRN